MRENREKLGKIGKNRKYRKYGIKREIYIDCIYFGGFRVLCELKKCSEIKSITLIHNNFTEYFFY
jgi:hypothetical protein